MVSLSFLKRGKLGYFESKYFNYYFQVLFFMIRLKFQFLYREKKYLKGLQYLYPFFKYLCFNLNMDYFRNFKKICLEFLMKMAFWPQK